MASADHVSIEFMGKPYRVSKDTTLFGALLETGWDSVKGLGCMRGCCGACGVLYRLPGESHVRTGLACRVPVQDGVAFSLVGPYPFAKVEYDLSEISDPKQALFDLFPELTSCRKCGLCVQACPEGIDVQRAMWCAVFGDFAEVASLFKSCVQCGFCARACSVGICPFQIAIYASRAHGACMTEPPPALLHRVNQIEGGKYEHEWRAALQDRSAQP
jgi:ferredoxin